MYTVEHLRQLFEYNDWANRRVVAALRANPADRPMRVLAHLLITENEYFERLYGKDSKGFDFWPDLPIDELGELARANSERFEKLLRRFDEEGLDFAARYRTSEGVWRENTFREILAHVLLHSANHRGSIAAGLREAGFEPPATDYIIYLRETKYI